MEGQAEQLGSEREMICIDGPHKGHKAFLREWDDTIHLIDGSVYRRHEGDLRWDQTESAIQRQKYNAYLATRATKKRKIK